MSPPNSKDSKPRSGSRVSPKTKARAEKAWKAVQEASLRPLAPARPLTPPTPPTPLVPKELTPEKAPPRMSGAELLSIKNLLSPMPQDSPTTDTQSHEGNANNSRPKHQRTAAPRAFCSKCNKVPDGFKSKNELRRHVSIKHSAVVKRIVIRAGAESNLEIKKPFSECEPCAEGKGYNVDYSAAAHLRRVHFNPIIGPGKKRIHGERWPPMDDLRVFFEERMVRVGQGELTGSEKPESGQVSSPRQESPESSPELNERTIPRQQVRRPIIWLFE